jgi:fructose-1,6-bisphosphatase/inositol monophosphatase family enzyme
MRFQGGFQGKAARISIILVLDNSSSIYRRKSRVTQPAKHELQDYLRVAESVVQESQALVLSQDHQCVSQQIKPDGSPVTELDFAVEDFIRSRLRSAFPDHGIIGEERSETPSESGFQWIIDPIDGTRSFSHQIPLYGTLLSLRHEGQSIVGVVNLPGLGLLYAGASGLGVYRNGKPIRLSAEEAHWPVEQEILAIGERRQFVSCGRADVFDSLMQSALSVRTYCDCFGHALAIDGRVGAMVDYNVSIWDIAATELLVRESGGLFVHVNAGDYNERDGSRYHVVFGKPHVVEWVLDRVSG